MKRKWDWPIWVGIVVVISGLINSDGLVRCVNLTDNIAVRARPQQRLNAFDQIGLAGR